MNLLGSRTLETNRLILRKTEEKDLKELWNLLLLEEVSKYYLTSKINEDWEEEKKWQYKKLEKASNKATIWTIELKEEETIIGQISIQPLNEKEKDIGWFLDPRYQKKGYAQEAATEVLKYMFLEVEMERIKTCASIHNPNSFHLMEKLGFKKCNTIKKVKYTFLEKEEDCMEYILEKKDFLKEYFRKEKLFITIDIDKDPYIENTGGNAAYVFMKVSIPTATVVVEDDDVGLEREVEKPLLRHQVVAVAAADGKVTYKETRGAHFLRRFVGGFDSAPLIRETYQP